MVLHTRARKAADNVRLRKKRTTVKLRRSHHVKQHGGGKERLSREFGDFMYTNMWQYMNPQTIDFVLNAAGCSIGMSKKTKIDDDDFRKPKYHNTICQKGDIKDGHYVYVDATGKVTGTYENYLLFEGTPPDFEDGDDGICHGAAIAAALRSCGWNIPPFNTRGENEHMSDEKLNENYRIIFQTYLLILDMGWWEKAVAKFFPSRARVRENQIKYATAALRNHPILQ